MPSLISSRQIAGHPTARASRWASVVLPAPIGLRIVMSDVVDAEALGPSVGEMVDEGAARWAVTGRPVGVGEVDLEDCEVAAGQDADDLGPDAKHDRLTLVGRPCVDAAPPAGRVADLDVGGVGVTVGARYRGLVKLGVEVLPFREPRRLERGLAQPGSLSRLPQCGTQL